MIRALLLGLVYGLGAAALGGVGSYLFYEPPVQTLPNGDMVFSAPTILGLVVVFGLGFAAGFSTSRERRRPPRDAWS